MSRSAASREGRLGPGVIAAINGEPTYGTLDLREWSRACQVFAVRLRTGGILVAVPADVLTDAELEAHRTRTGDATEYGPFHRCVVSGADSSDDNVPVLILDISGGVVAQLRFDPQARSRQDVYMFTESALTLACLPSPEAVLVETNSWIEGAYDTGYWTAAEVSPAAAPRRSATRVPGFVLDRVPLAAVPHLVGVPLRPDPRG